MHAPLHVHVFSLHAMELQIMKNCRRALKENYILWRSIYRLENYLSFPQ